jgi:hypothetical protein
MMQKYKTKLKSTFCNFCKLVGHEEKNCRTLDLMKERTSDAYMMQDESMARHTMPHFGNAHQFQEVPQFQQPPQYNQAPQYHQHNMDP